MSRRRDQRPIVVVKLREHGHVLPEHGYSEKGYGQWTRYSAAGNIPIGLNHAPKKLRGLGTNSFKDKIAATASQIASLEIDLKLAENPSYIAKIEKNLDIKKRFLVVLMQQANAS
jgi:hypothetical protein